MFVCHTTQCTCTHQTAQITIQWLKENISDTKINIKTDVKCRCCVPCQTLFFSAKIFEGHKVTPSTGLRPRTTVTELLTVHTALATLQGRTTIISLENTVWHDVTVTNCYMYRNIIQLVHQRNSLKMSLPQIAMSECLRHKAVRYQEHCCVIKNGQEKKGRWGGRVGGWFTKIIWKLHRRGQHT